jgi:hypothetical protein
MADLRTRFAQIDCNGLGDGQFMASIHRCTSLRAFVMRSRAA